MACQFDWLWTRVDLCHTVLSGGHPLVTSTGMFQGARDPVHGKLRQIKYLKLSND